MVPIILYQAEQILCGQLAVRLFKRWGKDEVSQEEPPVQEVSMRHVLDEDEIGLVHIRSTIEESELFPKLELDLGMDEDSKEIILEENHFDKS
jgi:hypothetical protein